MAGPIIPINSLVLLCTSADLLWCARATTRQLRASALYVSDARQINWRGTLRQSGLLAECFFTTPNELARLLQR